MKKLITLFFISILSLQVYCSAQEILKVDYPAIKEYVTNHNTEFQKLMQRFEENDTLLTRQDHAMLYYGYSFTPAYKGSMDDFQDFRKLIKEEKYEDAYNIGKELLKKNPVSLQLLYNMYGIAGLLQKDIREIKHYSKRYAALLTMIALTGDGTSEETAFKVICVNDEYQLLNMLFKMENMKGQSLVNKCDLIEFDKCQYYEGNQMLNSTCKCNRILINNLFKFFVWREVSKSFTRSIIEFIFNPLNLFVGYFTKVLTLWDILPDKPVGVFIGTTFP
ncbi:hypothetical protein BSIG_5585 [Bacteroides thetaiotaomicron]|nr:hypothetical protein BSIG_5585 [Bacteroides thetaiotaomicron]